MRAADRLNARPDLPAEIWAEPSAEQAFWVRHAAWLFAPADDRSHLARWFGIVFVVPSTNVTNFSLHYQSYLNDIFHRTWTARIAHVACMPIVVVSALAVLASLSAALTVAAGAALG